MSKFQVTQDITSEEEEDENQQAQQQQEVKKSKKDKKKSKFEVAAEEDEDEQEEVVETKKSKKDKKKSKFEVAAEEDEEEQEEVVETKKSKKDKKKSKFEVAAEEDEEEQEEVVESKKSKKDKKKSKFEVAAEEDEDEQEEVVDTKKSKKDKKKSKFEVAAEEDEEVVETKKSKKDKKKSKFEVAAEDEDEEEEVEETKKSKKDKKKSKFEVQENEEEEEEEQQQQPKTLSKEEKKKLKALQKQKEEEEEAALLEQMMAEKKEQEQSENKSEKQQQQEQKEEEGEEGEDDENTAPGQKSKAQLKREKKKLKEKNQKENKGEDNNDNKEEESQQSQQQSGVSESKGKKKKGGANAKVSSKAALMLQEQLKKQQEEERLYQEKLKEAQEAEEKRVADLLAAEEEKKLQKQLAKEQKKADGKLLTKAQQKKQAALEKARRDFQLMQAQQQQTQQQTQQKVEEKVEVKKEEKQSDISLQKQQSSKKQETQPQKKVSDDVPEEWDADFDSQENSRKQSEEEKQTDKKSPGAGKKKKKSSDHLLDNMDKADIYQSKKPEKGVLRSPIICIMGHVDTGKTTLLDKLRHTNVQAGEAGGITQQIGATFFPGEKVIEQTKKCDKFYKTEVKAPGLLVIDTPGHESFANLRSRGSGLCDFAILVIDLMHGLEQQTLESIKLLTLRKTPFVIALNKIDRCYDWKSKSFESSFVALERQKRNTKEDFMTRYQKIVTQLAEIEKNAVLYWDNKDIKSFFPIVPTSGVTGEGIPDLLSVIIKYTSFFMKSRMMVKEDQFNCTVMEVKVIEGHGTTIDCILIDGVIKRGDTITVLGFNGPITTKIRALLTPHPMKELRVKGEYILHDQIYAAMGLKISAKGLEDAVAGCQLIVSKNAEELQEAEANVRKDLENVTKKVVLADHGVGVAASTIGSLEALLSFLKESKIPVSHVSIGPVSKDHINKAMKSLLTEDQANRKKEFATMLVFDVKVLKEAELYAEQQGVKIFTAQIIYHLQDQYAAYHRECIEERKQQNIKAAIFPSISKCIKIFRANKPLIIGVQVERGQLRIGTPLVAYIDGLPRIGTVESMESNGKPVKGGKVTKETGEVAVKIQEHGNTKGFVTFNENDVLISQITRHSIDCLKEHFKEEVQKDEWILIRDKLKKLFNIY